MLSEEANYALYCIFKDWYKTEICYQQNKKKCLEERIKRYDGGYRKRGFLGYDAVCLLDYKL